MKVVFKKNNFGWLEILADAKLLGSVERYKRGQTLLRIHQSFVVACNNILTILHLDLKDDRMNHISIIKHSLAHFGWGFRTL